MTSAKRFSPAIEQFRVSYAQHRASEGRQHSGAELRELPWLRSGPLARQWQVRAQTFDCFLSRVVRPMSRERSKLRVLDLGAGNGWLSYRLAKEGHHCVAVDLRDDAVDGLGAAAELAREHPFERIVASFDHLPLSDKEADLAVFNASLHYAANLGVVLAEAARVTRPGGCIAILDSPFYKKEADGVAMVAEKHRSALASFGTRAESLLALTAIEFITAERLETASGPLGLSFHRHPVSYPIWYKLRPFLAKLQGKRSPSRFDFWTARVL